MIFEVAITRFFSNFIFNPLFCMDQFFLNLNVCDCHVDICELRIHCFIDLECCIEEEDIESFMDSSFLDDEREEEDVLEPLTYIYLILLILEFIELIEILPFPWLKLWFF